MEETSGIVSMHLYINTSLSPCICISIHLLYIKVLFRFLLYGILDVIALVAAWIYFILCLLWLGSLF